MLIERADNSYFHMKCNENPTLSSTLILPVRQLLHIIINKLPKHFKWHCQEAHRPPLREGSTAHSTQHSTAQGGKQSVKSRCIGKQSIRTHLHQSQHQPLPADTGMKATLHVNDRETSKCVVPCRGSGTIFSCAVGTATTAWHS